MTIWINKRTGATRNQYTKPTGSDWEKKKESYSRSSSSSSYSSPPTDNFMGVGLAVAVATGLI